MRKLSYNPTSGLMTTTAEEDGRNVVKYEQNLQGHWDLTANARADTASIWREGMKEEMVKAAFVPDLVVVDMLTRFGVNFYDKNQRKRVLQLIETEYPKCKLVNKRLA
jgi:hypothetical protein